MEEFKFNVNNAIKVKINNKGYQYLADRHNELYKDIPIRDNFRSAEYYKNRADKYGYSKFQLWCFMNSFGEVTSLGKEMLFDSEIIICRHVNNN